MSKLAIRALAVALAVVSILGVMLVSAGASDTGVINLTGAAEVPGPGDPDGFGRAELDFRPGQGQICFDLSWTNLDPVIAAHIHRGTADVAGPVVVLFFSAPEGLTTNPAERTTLSNCVSGVDLALIREIQANPEGFYVNVHSTVFPAGAIRGQIK